MTQYVGLDVSLKQTKLHVLDEAGNRIWRGRCATEEQDDGGGWQACRPALLASSHAARHTCGHLLADAGHDTRRLQLWLGHSDIKHMAHYSELSARPFKDFWK